MQSVGRNPMKRLAAFSIATLAVCASAWAQPIGTATNVQGLVTVSDGQTLTNLQPGQPIPDGSTVITGSSSSVTLQVQVQGGPCSVNVGPGSQVQVSSTQTCSQLNSAVVASTASPTESFFAANGSGI